MEINYIDLGARYGEEIDIILRDNKDDIPINIYAVDADYTHTDYLKAKYHEHDNIHVYTYAISNVDAVQVKLFLERKRLGSSIFSSKYNIDSNSYQHVETITINTFIKRYIPNFDSAFNVLKMNIEGAEIYVYENLIEHKLIDKIDIFCGHPTHDIHKVSQLQDQIERYFEILDQYDIDIKYLCGETNSYNSINIFEFYNKLS